MVGYVAQTLLTGRVFSVQFANLPNRGLRTWLAMQMVGGAVTLAGDLRVEPGDMTEQASD